MKHILKIHNIHLNRKQFIIYSLIVIIFILTIVLSISFSIFQTRKETSVANLKVAGMNYGMSINGTHTNNLISSGNKVTIANIVITSFNNIDSKYELTYNVCATSECASYIQKPNDLVIEFSSRTIDSISGSIISNDTKQIRIAVTNTGSNTYYLKFGINAGYMHNTLVLQNLIASEYNEDDIKIAAIINGEISTTFPTTNNYIATVSCKKNGGSVNATGTASWNGTKWVLNISGVDTGQTVCNVNFEMPLKDKILAQGGGSATISAKGTPNFSVENGTSGLYAAEDDYGTSYYYRGLSEKIHNNLIWGGFQWKIIRINGDGSLRLIYNGTEDEFNTKGIMNFSTTFPESEWNTNSNDAKYVGYMYGGTNGLASTTRNGVVSTAATYNQTSSAAKSVLDNWYSTNILGKVFENQVVDNLFCNDRQLQSEVGGEATGSGYGSSVTNYAGYYRLTTTKNPTLKCGLKNDRFTKSDTTIGNGSLTYSIGLITADEVAMAGLVYGAAEYSQGNYLLTGEVTRTFTPFNMNTFGESNVYSFGVMGALFNSLTTQLTIIRPVISINSQLNVTGIGSKSNPYKVV